MLQFFSVFFSDEASIASQHESPFTSVQLEAIECFWFTCGFALSCSFFIPGTWHLAWFPSPTGFHRWSTSSQFPFGGAKNAALLFLVERSDSEWFHFFCSQIGLQNARLLQVLSTMWMRTYVCRSLQLSVFLAEMSYLEVMSWNWYDMRMSCCFLYTLCSHKFCLERNFRKQQNQTEREILLSDRYPLMIPTYPVVNSRCRDIFWNTDKARLRWWFWNVSIYCLFLSPIWEDFQFDEHLFFRWVG